jgi:hypothetical protein
MTDLPFTEAIIEADIEAFAGLVSLNRHRFGYEATQLLRQKGRDNPKFFTQAVATLMCYRYAVGFLHEPMRHQSKAWCELLEIFRRVRTDEANQYIKDLIAKGTLVEGTGVPAGLIAFFAAEYQGAVYDFAMDALKTERLDFVDRPFDGVRQTDDLATYPPTLKMCRLIEVWYSLFRLTPLNLLLELINCV